MAEPPRVVARVAEGPCVLDTSALLALLLREPGADRVAAALPAARISAVNFAEVLGVLSRRGLDPVVAAVDLAALRLPVEPFVEHDARQVGAWEAPLHRSGLGLGDRACLALAARLGLPALTADRPWAQIDLGVEVRLIR